MAKITGSGKEKSEANIQVDIHLLSDEELRGLLLDELELLEHNPAHSMDLIQRCSEKMGRKMKLKKKRIKAAIFNKIKQKPYVSIWKRIVLAICLILSLMVMAQLAGTACGFNLFSEIVSWGREQFSIQTIGKGQIQEDTGPTPHKYLDENNLTDDFQPFIPESLPIGYQFQSGIKQKRGAETQYTLTYKNTDQGMERILRIFASVHTENSHIGESIQEKNQGDHRVWESNGITFYFSLNHGRSFCSWISESAIMTICADMNETDIKTFIDENYGG